tara:strand:- start:152 stop:514 length:363 start_codon:yes stop_codon:yes gene_type:complete
VFVTGTKIEYNANIGEGFLIAHSQEIVIGRGSIIGNHVTVYQGVSLGVKDLNPENINKFPIIENDVILFAGAKIIGNVRVGRDSIVGTNSVVVNDIPPNSVAVGVPAKIVKKDHSALQKT